MLANPPTWYLEFVESTTLSAFFHEMKSWPATDAELGSACGWLSRLTGAPFVALYLAISPDTVRVAQRSNGASPSERTSPELLREFLRRQISQAPREAGQLRHVQVSRDQPGFPGLPQGPHLSLVSAGGGRLWIFAVGTKAPSSKDEILLLAFAEHLNHLAEKNDLEQKVQLRNQFLSIASHELKTPLTSIYGMLQLQERMIRLRKDDSGGPQREKQHAFLKMVIRQVERLNELIDGLLDVSRIQAGRFAIEPTETDVASILKDLANARLGLIASDASVRLSVDSPASLQAWVDPVRMEEVITNLVMNAIRFSPEGGAVWIKLANDNGSFRLTVRDQGPSVPLEDRERIFQPFERAQRTSRLGGLGLGLFISRQIAQLHGGTVSLVESIPGKGNAFEAHFPLRGVTLVSA